MILAARVKFLGNLKSCNALGPDNIINAVLKHLRDVIIPALIAIFQKLLDTGQLPEDWRSTNMATVFRKGKKYVASNYHPISQTGIC